MLLKTAIFLSLSILSLCTVTDSMRRDPSFAFTESTAEDDFTCIETENDYTSQRPTLPPLTIPDQYPTSSIGHPAPSTPSPQKNSPPASPVSPISNHIVTPIGRSCGSHSPGSIQPSTPRIIDTPTQSAGQTSLDFNHCPKPQDELSGSILSTQADPRLTPDPMPAAGHDPHIPTGLVQPVQSTHAITESNRMSTTHGSAAPIATSVEHVTFPARPVTPDGQFNQRQTIPVVPLTPCSTVSTISAAAILTQDISQTIHTAQSQTPADSLQSPRRSVLTEQESAKFRAAIAAMRLNQSPVKASTGMEPTPVVAQRPMRLTATNEKAIREHRIDIAPASPVKKTLEEKGQDQEKTIGCCLPLSCPCTCAAKRCVIL